jgi:hypothetical protein
MMNQENAHSGANPEPTENSSEEICAESQADTVDESDHLEETQEELGEDSIISAPPRPRIPLPPSPPIPSGTLPLLDAQLGEALKFMQNLSAWIRHPYSAIHTCIFVADSVSGLVQASATLGKVASHLQNGDPESRHRGICRWGGGAQKSKTNNP